MTPVTPAAETAVKVEPKVETKAETPKKTCPACKDDSHPLYRCHKFKEMTFNQRRNVINRNKHCSNCLNHSHQAANCTSKYTCKFCKQPHNYLLHKESDEEKKTTTSGVALAALASQPASEAQAAPEESQTVELG